MTNIKNRYFKFVTLLLGIGICITLAYILFKNSRDKLNEFPYLKIIDRIEGVVTYKEKIIRGSNTRIEISNKYKYTLFTTQNDVYYPNSHFSDIVEIGDSIYKASNSDSIFIYRNDHIFYFIEGEHLYIKE
jgi:hypothetical protein